MSLMAHIISALLALFVVSTVLCTIHTAQTAFSTQSILSTASSPSSTGASPVPTNDGNGGPNEAQAIMVPPPPSTVTEQFVQTAMAQQAPPPLPAATPQGGAERPEGCTAEQREGALWQLPAERCEDHACPSVENETACPVEGWMHTYLRTFDSMHSFLGLTVGCDTVSNVMTAVDILRRASQQNVMDSNMNEFQGIVEHEIFPQELLTDSTCAPPAGIETSVGDSSNDPSKARVAEMHCIEPMPYVVDPLHAVVTSLGWNDPSNAADRSPTFVVSPVAIAKDHGGRLFLPLEAMDEHAHHRHESVQEACAEESSKGLVNANLRAPPKCRAVPTYNLNSYLKSFAPQQNRMIHYLKLDGEGYDYDLLLGSGHGADDMLRRTLYLQLERHSKGSWANQSLRSLVDRLDRTLGFTCYLAGRNKLWRISDDTCFLPHYDVPCWSNVACVNRVLPGSKALLQIMEQTYRDTLDKKYAFVPAKTLQTGRRRPVPTETHVDDTRHHA